MQLPREEAEADFYDEVASVPMLGFHYTRVIFYLMYLVIVDRLRHNKNQRILDLGCGSGYLAQLLKDQGFTNYLGIDFSPGMLEIARSRDTGFNFVLADLRDSTAFAIFEYDMVIATEFVEHVEGDLAILRRVAPGSRLLISSTNDTGHPHVRYFKGLREMKERYESLYTDTPDAVTVVAEHKEAMGLRSEPWWKKFFILDGVRCG